VNHGPGDRVRANRTQPADMDPDGDAKLKHPTAPITPPDGLRQLRRAVPSAPGQPHMNLPSPVIRVGGRVAAKSALVAPSYGDGGGSDAADPSDSDHDLKLAHNSTGAFPLRRGLPRHLPRMTGEGRSSCDSPALSPWERLPGVLGCKGCSGASRTLSGAPASTMSPLFINTSDEQMRATTACPNYMRLGSATYRPPITTFVSKPSAVRNCAQRVAKRPARFSPLFRDGAPAQKRDWTATMAL